MRPAASILALLLISCGGPSLTGPRLVRADVPACKASAAPLAIVLRATKGPGIEAVMSSCSDVDQVILHDSHLQACRLVLVDGDGREVESFDARMVMKFDNMPYEHLFLRLAPEDGIVLHEERFMQRDDGGWEMLWGPYRFDDIAPGTYSARVEWTSALDSWFVEETEQYESIEGIWTGTVSSNEVTLTLP